MRRWLTRILVQRVYQAMRDGNPEPAIRMFRSDARFRFAGTHSWAIDTDNASAIRSWFERFTSLRPQLRLSDVLVGGPPWRMSVCVVFDDAIQDDPGEVIYRNHGVQYLKLRWGRVILDDINLDTQRVAEYDARGVSSDPH
jgi:ketosteroid isomerase-like protein